MTTGNSNIPNPSWYPQEADTFVGIMRDMVPNLPLDYSAESIPALEQFITRQFDPPGSKYVGENLIIGVGCYLGEVIVRTLGGHWNTEGKREINGIGPIQEIFPINKAKKRFENGPVDSLVHYFETVARYARQT